MCICFLVPIADEFEGVVDILAATSWPGVDDARVLLQPHEVDFCVLSIDPCGLLCIDLLSRMPVCLTQSLSICLWSMNKMFWALVIYRRSKVSVVSILCIMRVGFVLFYNITVML